MSETCLGILDILLSDQQDTYHELQIQEQGCNEVEDENNEGDNSLLQGYCMRHIGKGRFVEELLVISASYLSFHSHPGSAPKVLIGFEDVFSVSFWDGDDVARQTFSRPTSNHIAVQHEVAEMCFVQSTDFILTSCREGYHRGREFHFRARTMEKKQEWVLSIGQQLKKHFKTPISRLGTFELIRKHVRWYYIGVRCQIFVALLITCNFLVNILEAYFNNIDPDSDLQSAFNNIDTSFSIIFTVELSVNLFSTLIKEFCFDGWNWFDLVVVVVSLLDIIMTDLPGAGPLRLLRCFRVFRLFKRIPSLRQLMVALTSSVPAVTSAFVLMILISAIYSIVGVTFFKNADPENFGDFFTGMFTIFQVMTGDGWSDIARSLFLTTGSPVATAFFFVSFQLTVGLVLLNVVIAVLLDEFSRAAERRSTQILTGEEGTPGHALDRLAADLSGFRNAQDLEARVQEVFISTARGGLRRGETTDAELMEAALTFEQVREGLIKLGHMPPIILRRMDWNDLVVSRGLLSADPSGGRDGVLRWLGFRAMAFRAVRTHALSSLNCAMTNSVEGWNHESVRAIGVSVRGLLLSAHPAAEPSAPSTLRRRPVLAHLPGAGARMDDGGVPPPGPMAMSLTQIAEDAEEACRELDALDREFRAALSHQGHLLPPPPPAFQPHQSPRAQFGRGGLPTLATPRGPQPGNGAAGRVGEEEESQAGGGGGGGRGGGGGERAGKVQARPGADGPGHSAVHRRRKFEAALSGGGGGTYV